MKGIINKGVQEFVETNLGPEAWEQIEQRVGCEEPFFAASQDYPDQLTFDLAAAAAAISGQPLESILLDLGRFWVTHIAAEAYPSILKLTGTNARELLLNMDRVHTQATRSIANARPPRFEYEELPDGRLLMHYHSERRLCGLLKGLILGVGELFHEDLEVRETSCVAEGSSHCTMEVTFP